MVLAMELGVGKEIESLLADARNATVDDLCNWDPWTVQTVCTVL